MKVSRFDTKKNGHALIEVISHQLVKYIKSTTCTDSYPIGMLIPMILPEGTDSSIIRLKSHIFLAC